ncbi:DNA internalization-related competence protein ComEC/Rec2 [Achromobacter aloeverae]|nr:DNA internalization-related competence protein ComEC/Rec2 [Achromobacter aloeverae]
MRGRAIVLTWVAATAGVQMFADLPGGLARVGLALAALALIVAGHLGHRLGRCPGRCLVGSPASDVAVRATTGGGTVRLREMARTLGYCLAAACLAVANASERAAWRINDALPERHDNEVSRVLLRVTGLPAQGEDHVRFDADVLHAVPGPVPATIRVDWWRHGRDAPLPVLAPGQVWHTALLLRRPHAALNPHAADGSARLFHDGVRALASVRGQPRLVPARMGVSALVDRARYALRTRLSSTLGAWRYGGVVIALALGDQAAIHAVDWAIFNATGVTHLVSISGLHVSLVAGLAGLGWAWCWRRLRWRGVAAAERAPAQVAGGVVALAVAAVYCALAGWGLPAQRTFFMLAVALGAWLLRLPLSPGRVWVLAAGVVTLVDPWAPLAAGFWLSFGAVAVLMACGARGTRRPVADAGATGLQGALRRQGARLMAASRLQLTINIALAPVLAVLTQQLSVAAPLANAFAIPVISLVATPLALLAAALHALPACCEWQSGAQWVAWAAHCVIASTMAPLAWLADQDWAVRSLAAPPWGLVALALAGTAWALMVAGWPARRWGWLLLVPALAWRPDRPAPGAWSMTVLDVGQGGAAVVRTARHTLLFDAGPLSRSGSDAGTRVVWPYLRAEGIARLDTLVLSHGDLDHAGGVRGVLQGVVVADTYASFNLPARLRAGAYRNGERRGRLAPGPRPRPDSDPAADPDPAGAASGADADAAEDGAAAARLGVFRRCQAGQAWTVDGVRFDFLHPPLPGHAAGRRAGRSNENGCVLRIRGRYHSALLPGDIGVDQEDALAGTLGRIDVVLAPHHGSATSSGEALVRAAAATQLIVQAGYRNRFGHPAARVLSRWQRAGTDIWRTDLDGAVRVDSGGAGLHVRAMRDERARYWHGR